MKKYEIFVNDNQFQQLKKEAAEQATKVLEGIEALRAEGISTDEKTLKMLTATPDALENYLRDCAQNQIGTGFVPPEEKSRIYEVYSKLLARIKDKFHLMRECLSTTPILFEGEKISIDWKKLEQIAKYSSTYEVDNEGLKNYWEKVEAIQTAIDELRVYEVTNGLPNFRESGITFTSDLGMFQNPKLFSFLMQNGNKETFFEIAMQTFTKKK